MVPKCRLIKSKMRNLIVDDIVNMYSLKLYTMELTHFFVS
jgi:hypothetical protein